MSFQYHPEAVEPTPQEAVMMQAVSRLSEYDGLGIGLTGAHRTGKTTIVKQLVEKNSAIPMVQASVSEIAKRHGFDINAANTLEERLAFQEIVLREFAADYESHNGLFITDRTPLDFAAYMLADVRGGAVSPKMDELVADYVQRCIDLTVRHFAMVVAIQPGIPYVDEPGKPLPSRCYQEEISAIIIGLGVSRYGEKRTFRTLDRSVIDRQKRVNAVAALTSGVLNSYAQLLQTLPRQ